MFFFSFLPCGRRTVRSSFLGSGKEDSMIYGSEIWECLMSWSFGDRGQAALCCMALALCGTVLKISECLSTDVVLRGDQSGISAVLPCGIYLFRPKINQSNSNLDGCNNNSHATELYYYSFTITRHREHTHRWMTPIINSSLTRRRPDGIYHSGDWL